MDQRKSDAKDIENDISSALENDDALARLCNTEVGVLINSPADLPYVHVYGSPCFNDEVKRFHKASARRVRFSARQTRILMYKAKLDRLMEELKQNKAYEKVLRKRQEQNFKNFSRKEILNLNLEDLDVFKKKLENLQNDLKKKRVDMESSFSQLTIPKNKDNK